MHTTHEAFQLRKDPGTFQVGNIETHGINVDVTQIEGQPDLNQE